MNKEQVLFYLSRAKADLHTLSPEEIANGGWSYPRRKAAEDGCEANAAQAEAVDIALSLVEKYYHV